MELTVTPEALTWFKKELVVDEERGVRFFGKIYGKTQVHDGFSVGMSVDKPERTIVEKKIDDLVFFIDETDEWFFKGYDLEVGYDQTLDEPDYKFIEIKE